MADGTLFSLLSNNDVSYMAIPFDNFDLAQAAHGKGIQSIAITGGQVPCPELPSLPIFREISRFLIK